MDFVQIHKIYERMFLKTGVDFPVNLLSLRRKYLTEVFTQLSRLIQHVYLNIPQMSTFVLTK